MLAAAAIGKVIYVYLTIQDDGSAENVSPNLYLGFILGRRDFGAARYHTELPLMRISGPANTNQICALRLLELATSD